jgi:hypothetical protein
LMNREVRGALGCDSKDQLGQIVQPASVIPGVTLQIPK